MEITSSDQTKQVKQLDMKTVLSKVHHQTKLPLLLLLISMIVVSCELDEPPRLFPDPPMPLTIHTNMVKDITTTSALCGGVIKADGGASILTKGVCWSTAPAPTTADKVQEDEMDSDTIKVTLHGLMMHTIYYVRPFATTRLQTIYGDEISFTTQ